MDVPKAQSLFDPQPGWLNTASYGLPPRPAWDALQDALADWRAGRTSWEGWGEATVRARESFARLVGVPASDVSTGAQVSQMIAPIAAGLPDGARVLAPVEEFASNLYPWFAQAPRGVEVRTVPARDLAAAVDDGTDLVAFSLVQSATGEVADVDATTAAAVAAGALTVVDATQACGWLPVDASRFDALVCGAYKWLLAPRGTAFLHVAPARRDELVPSAAGWYAGASRWDSIYGEPLRLAANARRFDVSPAWLAWVGTQEALRLIEEVGVAAVHRHDVGLANDLRAHLGLPASNSAVVSIGLVDDRPLPDSLRASMRAGRLRVCFHLYNTADDVDRVADYLAGARLAGQADG